MKKELFLKEVTGITGTITINEYRRGEK